MLCQKKYSQTMSYLVSAISVYLVFGLSVVYPVSPSILFYYEAVELLFPRWSPSLATEAHCEGWNANEEQLMTQTTAINYT